MQEWGYLSDPASMEKISSSTINCESDRRKREGGLSAHRRKGGHGKGCSAHGSYADSPIQKLIFAKAAGAVPGNKFGAEWVHFD